MFTDAVRRTDAVALEFAITQDLVDHAQRELQPSRRSHAGLAWVELTFLVACWCTLYSQVHAVEMT